MEPFGEEHAAKYDRVFEKLTAWMEGLRLTAQIALRDLPERAHILCVGAGTGAELLHLAEANPGWRFTAVDPSRPMLDRCRARAAAAGIDERCSYHDGYLDSLDTDERFDGATAILVSQFIRERDQRIDFFRQIHARVRPGAPLISADLSPGPADAGRGLFALWESSWRHADVPEEQLAMLRDGRFEQLVSLATREEYAALLTEAGWFQPLMVYQAVLIHGWLATA